jgi:hypothetical protein
MTVVSRKITVRWNCDGYHRWPGAQGTRAYLADRHRHRFVFAVTVPVEHHDRDIEFHDLLDWCQDLYPGRYDFGSWSCERIAEDVALRVTAEFGPAWVMAEVSEDGYVTATVETRS